MDVKYPRISAIVSTYNRLEDLRYCLDGFARQTLLDADYEVLVMDNNCTDGTSEWLREKANDWPWMRHVPVTDQGLCYCRNRGIDESRADLVVFVDDDAAPVPEFLSEYLKAFDAYPKVLCAGGKVHLNPAKPLADWMTEGFLFQLAYLDYGDEPMLLDGKDGPWGVNMGFRRVAFEKYGNFDNKLGRKSSNLLSNEDTVFISKIRETPGQVLYWPKAMVYHRTPVSRLRKRYFIRRAYWQGISNVVANRANGEPCEPASDVLKNIARHIKDLHTNKPFLTSVRLGFELGKLVAKAKR